MSIVALTWQIVAWRLSGSVVKVDLLGGAVGDGGIVSGPLPVNFDKLMKDGFELPVYVIRARNVGRLAVNITHWTLSTDGGFGFAVNSFRPNPALPHRLEVGADVSFYVPVAEALHAFRAVSNAIKTQKRMKGKITLATGVERASKRCDLPNRA